MLYYSFEDIMRSHKITKEALKWRIKSGKLKAHKLAMSRTSENYFKYIIPETELSKLEEYKQREPTASPDAQPDYYTKKWQESEEMFQRWQENCRIEQERRKQQQEYWAKVHEEEAQYRNYYDYLKSEAWRQRRLEALKRDKFKCQLCGSGKDVEVHHISYEHLHRAEEVDDLITLCKKCHREVHSGDLEKRQNPEWQRTHRLLMLAVKKLREYNRVKAWEQFEKACSQSTPPLSTQEVSRIWQNALKAVCPL